MAWLRIEGVHVRERVCVCVSVVGLGNDSYKKINK